MTAGLAVGAETNTVTVSNIFDRPLSLVDASDIALRQNLAIRKEQGRFGSQLRCGHSASRRG